MSINLLHLLHLLMSWPLIECLLLFFRLLTGKSVKSLDDAWDALGIIHKMGPETVVVSSSELSDKDSLLCLGSMLIGKFHSKSYLIFGVSKCLQN